MKVNLVSQSVGQLDSGRTLVMLAVLVVASSVPSPAQTPASPEQPPEITVSQPATYCDPTLPCWSDIPLYDVESPCYRLNALRQGSGCPIHYFLMLDATTETVTRDFVYQVTLRNDGDKIIKSVDWNYIFIDPDSQQEVALHRFTTQETILPRRRKTIVEYSPSPPTKVISVKALAERRSEPFIEKVLITRVTYADGSVWQPQPARNKPIRFSP